MSNVVVSIGNAFRRNRELAERALQQLTDEELESEGPSGSSSVATIVWHMGANLESRFTDFLSSDGEKPWREREAEFSPRHVTRPALMKRWIDGWTCLDDALANLTDTDLSRTVRIRHEPMTVTEALHRALAHAAYHVGQIVYIARSRRGSEWKWLSIPPGGTEAYNRRMAERFGGEAPS